ncbi:hypothetical protein BGY98DRAFT_646874 [Russula aff. rugulosa BPL654]|nr:hypothetical protein BGY98DRAFT_646874 [Russula aff. rugulosa BPL654]
MSSPQLTQEHLHQPVSSTDPAIAPTSLPGTGEESAQGGQAQVTADILPDFALLEIFDWYLFQSQEEADDYVLDVEAWHTLVHVCQRWRAIVFTSPHRLNLRLFFTNGTSVETLAVWPSFPIIIWQSGDQTWDLDDIIEALDYNDRVCEINLLDIPNPQLEEALAAMEQPFPALTELGIRWQDDDTDEIDEAAPVVSDSFLGGSAPRLQHLDFYRVPFPGLPGLLLSATDLVHLYLWKIPHLGYFSPEAMVNCLSALTKLEILWLGFESFQPRLYQDNRCTSPMRSVLPSLTSVKFKGAVSTWRISWLRSLPRYSIAWKYHSSIIPYSTLHNFSSSSIAHRTSRHPSKHMWTFPMTAFRSHFPVHYRESFFWKSYADLQILSFCL